MTAPQPRTAVRALIVRDGRLLLVNATRDRGDGKWCTPGGGIDRGEDMKTGLAREVFEETGLTVEIGALKAVSEYFNRGDDFHQIDIFFAAHITGGTVSDDWKDEAGVVQNRRFFAADEMQSLHVFPAFLKDGFWGHAEQKAPIYRGTEEGGDFKWKM